MHRALSSAPRAVTLLTALAVCGSVAHGQVDVLKQKELERKLDGVGVDQHLGALLPLDARFVASDGEATTLGAYFDGQHPVVLTLNYIDCPQQCSAQLGELNTAMAEIGLSLGDDYRVVAVSIDPRDTPEKAAGVEQRYASDYLYMSEQAGTERPESAAAGTGWAYLVGEQLDIDRVSQATGYNYNWVADEGEYAHPAVTILCSPDGTITRYLPGIGLESAKTLELALLEAGQGKIGTLFENAFLTCFIFDPTTGRYSLAAVRLLKVAAALTALAVACGVFFMRRGEAQRTNDASSAASADEGTSQQ